VATFQNSRWRPSAILDFQKCDFLPIGSLGLLIFYHGTKFGAKMLIDDQIMAQKWNLKWWPPLSWIYFCFLTFHCWSQPHTKFGANIAIGGWLMVIFQNSRWRPSAILDFRKSDFWPIGNLGQLIFHHGTKCGAKMLIDAHLMAQNRNPRWRPSAVLELLYVHIRPPTKLGSLHQHLKFYINPMNSFEDMGILIFLQIWLEMPIHAPIIWVFGCKMWENLPLGR